MDVMLSRGDIGQEAIDRAAIVVEQFRLIPTEHLEIAQPAGDFGDLRQRCRQIGLRLHGRQPSLEFANPCRSTHLLLDAAARDVDAPHQCVKQQPRPRQQEDEKQPGARRRRTPPGRHIDEHHEANHPFAGEVQCSPVGHHRASLPKLGPLVHAPALAPASVLSSPLHELEPARNLPPLLALRAS